MQKCEQSGEIFLLHNLIHASETQEEAEHEISFWFSPEEIHSYQREEEEMMF